MDYIFKYILVGDSGVGKSCIVLQATDQHFEQHHEITIGVEFGSTVVTIPSDGTRIQVELWDTAGQERFRSISRSYYRGSIGAILVYDVTNRQSFHSIHQWVADLREHAASTMQILLVGNKVDLTRQRCVTTEEGRALAASIGKTTLFMEVSATSISDVVCLVAQLTHAVYGGILDGTYDPEEDAVCGIKQCTPRLRLHHPQPKTPSGNCCG